MVAACLADMWVLSIRIGWHMSHLMCAPRASKQRCSSSFSSSCLEWRSSESPECVIQIAGNFETWPPQSRTVATALGKPPTRSKRSMAGAMASLQNWWHCQFGWAPVARRHFGLIGVGGGCPAHFTPHDESLTPLHTPNRPHIHIHIEWAHPRGWCIAMTFSCFICGWPRINSCFPRPAGSQVEFFMGGGWGFGFANCRKRWPNLYKIIYGICRI